MTNAEFLGAARTHLLDYMRTHPEPITTPDLLRGLLCTSPLPLSNGNITRSEAYRCMIVSERQKRTIETAYDYKMVWHEYTKEGERYRGHPYND